MLRLALALFFASVLSACGPAKPKCLPSNCSGCCDAKGLCQAVPSPMACGLRGSTCVACAGDQLCVGGFCSGNAQGGGSGGGGGSTTGGGGGSVTGGGGGSVTGGGGGSTTGGGGGSTTGGGGGSVTGGGGGSTTGGGGGSVTGGGGGSVTGGGGGSVTGGGGGSMSPGAQIDAVRAAADQGSSSVSLPISGAQVTVIKPSLPDAGTSDPAGFFLQAGAQGPAVFISGDANAFGLSVGDLVELTVTGVTKITGMRVATSVIGVSKLGTAALVSGQSSSTTNFTATGAIDSLESELVSLNGTVVGAAAPAGNGFQSFGMTTAGHSDPVSLRLRLPNALADSEGLGDGCSIQLTGGPLWRFNSTAQPSAFGSLTLAGSSCPAPKLTSAVATSATSVRVAFDRPMNPATVSASNLSIAGLTVSQITGGPSAWSLTTTSQTAGASYTVSASASVADVRGSVLNSGFRTANFTGFQASAAGLVINEVDYDNVGTDSAEFIELRNAGTGSVDLTGMSVVVVNGTGNVVLGTITLPSMMLGAGAYLVIGSTAVINALPTGIASASLGFSLQNDNEGIVLLSAGSAVLDSMTYEQATPATLTYNTVPVTEGTTATTTLTDSNSANVSIGRNATSTDTNNNVPDFTVNSAPTPGAVNVP